MSIGIMKKILRNLKLDKLFRNKKFLITFAVLLLIVISYFIYIIIANKLISYNSAKLYQAAEAKNKIYTQADAVAVKNGANAGQSELDKNLVNSKSDTDKAYVYCAKSSLAMSDAGGKDYDKALEYAKKAEKLNPTASTAALIAGIYEKTKDKDQAIKFYQLAIDRLSNSKSAMDKADVSYYKKTLEALKE